MRPYSDGVSLPARSAVRRRLAAAGLAVVPVTLALSLPAHAATSVGVTAAAETCGVVLAVSGLGEGEHPAAVTVVSVASGDVVPALPGAGDGPAGGAAAGTTATLALTDGDLLVALDAQAVPDDDPRVEVEVVVDGARAADAALTLAACGATTGGTPTPEPTPGGTAGPTPGGSASPTPDGSASPTPDGSASPTPDVIASPTPGGSASPTPGGSAGPTPGGSGSPTPSPDPTAGPTPGGSTGPTPGGSAGPTPDPTGTPTRTADPTAAGPTGGRTAGPRPLESPRRVSVGGATTRSPAPVVPTTPGAEISAGTGSGSSGGFLGNGRSGYLPSLSWGSSPLSALAGPAPVPAPVIAPPVGIAAGTSGQLVALTSPLDRLLGRTATASGPQEAEPATLLAVPSRSTTGASDPLVDLAPAAFLLTAWLGSMLTSGRRRSS